MSAAKTTHWFQASRTGNGVGLTVLASESTNRFLVVHVLPKPWRPAEVASSRYVLAESTGGVIRLYEQDYLGLPPELGRYLASVARPVAAETESADPFADFTNDPLWSKASPPAPSKTQVDESPHTPDPDAMNALWVLLGHYKLPRVEAKGSVTPALSGAPKLVALDGVRPLVAELFVRRCIVHAERRKPAYHLQVASLSALRGRPTELGILRHQSRPAGTIECEFEEQADDVEFWELIRFALELCRGDGLESKVDGCLRLLPMSRRLATEIDARAYIARNTPPTDQQLAELYGLARALIAQEFAFASEPDRSSGGVLVNLKFSTARLWELMLAQAFESAGCAVDDKLKLNMLFHHNPDISEWRASSHPKLPDLRATVLGDSSQQLIADAKYMQTEPGFTRQKLSPQYQAIAYALRTGYPTILCSILPNGTAPEKPDLCSIPPPSVAHDTRRATGPQIDWVRVGLARLPFARIASSVEEARQDLHASVQNLISAVFPPRPSQLEDPA